MNYELKPHLEKILEKLKKKDQVAHQAVKAKIIEIVNTNPEHYKPLKHNMKTIKSVHVMKSFVLIFTYDQRADFLSFLDYDHHDNIYRKYR